MFLFIFLSELDNPLFRKDKATSLNMELFQLPYWEVKSFLLGLIGFLLTIIVRKRKLRMSFLQRNGIPGPEPHWFYGNLREYLETPNVLWDGQLLKKYGPVCGYYLGAKPVILISDLQLIDRIQRKEGNHFLDRPRRVPGGINPDPKRAEMLGNRQVPEWKFLRGILDKGFSPKNLKSMSTDNRNLIKVFMSQLSPDVEKIDFYTLYQNFTLDLIGKTGFGVESNIQENPDEDLKAAVEQEFSKSTGTTLLKIYLCCPEIQGVLQSIRVAWEKFKTIAGYGCRSELWNLGARLLRERCHQKTARTDLLQVMLDSRRLNEDAIVANCVLFFEAGFETMSASLAFITHLLIKNLKAQDNVRQEIRHMLEDTGGVLDSLDKLKGFKYLEAVIKEGLRMFPPQTTFIGRSGQKTIDHSFIWQETERHCTIPAGTHIQICLYQILNSKETWESPRNFLPQRFQEERGGLTEKQLIAFQPFGRGKRICIGRKYAEMVLKMILIELFSKFRVVPMEMENDNNDEEVEVIYKTATMTPKTGVFGKVCYDPLFPEKEHE